MQHYKNQILDSIWNFKLHIYKTHIGINTFCLDLGYFVVFEFLFFISNIKQNEEKEDA